MISYPILFGYRDLITCRGFIAFVKADGRAVLEHEDDGDQWLYGVYPGGIAGGGKETAEAARTFKKRYLSVLFDIAEDAPDFDSFKKQVDAFFYEANEATKRAWDAAHAEVKKGKLQHQDLPKVDANTKPVNIEVLLVRNEDAKPSRFNRFDDFAEAA